jgi:hypothetical protein
VTKNKLAKLKKAVKIELEESHGDAGILYEYPLCCSTNYEAISNGSKWLKLMLDNSIGTFFDPRTNKLSYLVYGYTLFPDYFPCSFHCGGTANLSSKYFQLGLKSNLKDYVEMQYSMMKRPYLVTKESVFSFSDWNIENENILNLKMDSLSCFGPNYLSAFQESLITIKLPVGNENCYWNWNNHNFRVLLFSDEYSIKY